jgi:RNA methyltransferase, TrmH family
MIASESNPKIKLVRRLQTERRVREREQLLVVEGVRWLAELVAPDAPKPVMLFATAVFLADPAHQPLLQKLPLDPLVVPPQLMAAMSGTSTPPGILAVLPWPELAWPNQPTLLLILDNLRDPGNMGTIIRTAAAAGVDGVLLSPGCVDPFNPKVVRSSMGGILRLPLQPARWAEIAQQTAGLAVYLAAGEAKQVYTAVDWLPPSALIIGGEADGATSEARSIKQTAVAIPMARHTESLNAAVAASIILFEAVRQRRS